MQSITNLRHAELAQIAVNVFDEMGDFVSAHLRKRYGHAFRRQLVVPFVRVVAMVACEDRPDVEIGVQVRLLHQIPNLLLDEGQLGRIELLDDVVLVDELVEGCERTLRSRRWSSPASGDPRSPRARGVWLGSLPPGR